MKSNHPKQKVLAGKELYEATWEDAKAWEDAYNKELFEEAQKKGTYYEAVRSDIAQRADLFYWYLHSLEFEMTVCKVISVAAVILSGLAFAVVVKLVL